MDLKEFVSAALLQITEAVSESQQAIREKGGFVNPSASPWKAEKEGSTHFATLPSGQNVLLVDFDVAVTASEAVGASGGAKLSVASVFSIGADGKSNTSTESTSRIRFKVPLALPVDSESKATFDKRQADKAAKFNNPIPRSFG